MAEEYPFPVSHPRPGTLIFGPDPLWQRYAAHWTPRHENPLAVECLQYWMNAFKNQVQIFDDLFDYFTGPPKQDTGARVDGVLTTLKSLLNDGAALIELMHDTLPTDPVMRRWVKEASKAQTQERKDTKQKKSTESQRPQLRAVE